MNIALILAGGTGQRMRRTGMPKQFLEVYGKPIIIYTLQKFESCEDIDKTIVVCHSSWKDYMQTLINRYDIQKVKAVISGGKDRQDSILSGIRYLRENCISDTDVIVIHDGVRPLINESIINENIRVAQKFGCAMTVRPVVESVIITNTELASFDNFNKRDDTYSLTAPQSFQFGLLKNIYESFANINSPIPLLDTALIYTYLGNSIHIIKDNNKNIKITTPEDYYILKAMLELEENRYVFGI